LGLKCMAHRLRDLEPLSLAAAFDLPLQRLGQPHVEHVALHPPARSRAFHVHPRLLPAMYYVCRFIIS